MVPTLHASALCHAEPILQDGNSDGRRHYSKHRPGVFTPWRVPRPARILEAQFPDWPSRTPRLIRLEEEGYGIARDARTRAVRGRVQPAHSVRHLVVREPRPRPPSRLAIAERVEPGTARGLPRRVRWLQ